MEEKENVEKYYTNGEITIVWKPNTCTHAKKCWRNLPEVFSPMSRPWINIDGATTERIKQQVEACPSGALTWKVKE